MANRNRICRLCFKKCHDFVVIEGNTKQTLSILLLKLNLTISAKPPVMCKNCAEILQKCFDFKAVCLYTHGYTFTFVQNDYSANLDLKIVCLGKKKDDDIIDNSEEQNLCQFCMGVSKSCLVSLDNEETLVLLGEMVEKCLPELDFNIISKKPVICTLCHGSLENYFLFITNCTDAEEKIKKYCKAKGINDDGPIELSDVLKFTPKNTLTSKEDCKRVEIIKVEENLWEKTENENEVKHKNRNDVVTEDQKYNGVLPLTSTRKKCYEEEVEAENENKIFLKMECQKLLVCDNEEMEIKTDPLEFDSFQDGVVPQTEISNQLPRNEKCIMMYQCDVCPYQATRKCYLKKHMLVHKTRSEVTMYQCEFCSFETKYKNHRNTHQLIHKNPSEVTMYKCDLCSYETIHKRVRNRHMLMHKTPSEVTMYQCEFCPLRSKYKSSITKHMLTHSRIC